MEQALKSATVRDPKGREWRVSVRMIPWGVRWRGPGGRKSEKSKSASGSVDDRVRWYDWMPTPDVGGLFDEGFSGFLIAVGVIAAIVMAVLFVLPAFIFLVEVLIILLLMASAIAIRTLFRRPWLVDAVADDGRHNTWKVVGYFRSRAVVDEIARLLTLGSLAPTHPEATLIEPTNA